MTKDGDEMWEDGKELDWYIDDVFDEFLEILNGYLVVEYTFEDESKRDWLNAVEDIRGLEENCIANSLYDRNGVNMCWQVGKELRVAYTNLWCAMDIQRVVRGELDISAFMKRWPTWCNGLTDSFLST